MTDSCTLVMARLPDYVEGLMSADREWRISRHLAACTSCRRRVKTQRRLMKALGEMPRVRVPVDFRSSVMRRVVEAPLPVLVPPHRSHLKLVHLLIWTLAAVASGALGAGVRILARGHWNLPSLLDPVLLIERIGGLGRLALTLMLEVFSRSQLPSLMPSLHIPFASAGLAALITALIAVGLAAGALGLGVLATARSFLQIGRQ